MKSSSRGAFTIVEMVVAIAVFSLLLAVVFVPLRASLDSFHVSKARTQTQGATQTTLDEIERDLRRAVVVFPNAPLEGVTDKAPYSSNDGQPYVKSTDAGDTGTPQKGVCDKPAGAIAWSDPARLDMILAQRDASGRVITPVRPGDTMVSYYARRQRLDMPFDPVDNPVVLFRAQFPFRNRSGAFLVGGSPNADISSNRFPLSCTPSSNRGAQWTAHNVLGESNLEPLCVDGADTTNSGAHTLAVPRGVGLVASQAFKASGTFAPATEAPLAPDSSFDLSDTNGDGKIDRVTVALALQTFDSNQGANVNANNQPTGQIVRARRVVDLANVR